MSYIGIEQMIAYPMNPISSWLTKVSGNQLCSDSSHLQNAVPSYAAKVERLSSIQLDQLSDELASEWILTEESDLSSSCTC